MKQYFDAWYEREYGAIPTLPEDYDELDDEHCRAINANLNHYDDSFTAFTAGYTLGGGTS